MSDSGRGLPLLSGPPPLYEEQQDACRKCNKEFNVIFNRSRKCNHCGYSYCHACTDYQALMPRSGADTGYDAMHVCAFCVEFLTITAAGRTYLKSQPLAKLKKYVNAYDIKINRAVEKDDIIDAILAVRNPNACLPRENENFYRQYSVPNRAAGHRPRGIFTRPNPNDAPPVLPQRPAPQPTYNFPRPDLAPDSPPHPSPPPPQTYNRPSPVPPRPQYNAPPHPPPRPQSSSYPSGPTSPHNTHPHNHSYRTPPPAPPPPPHASRPPPQQSSYQHTSSNYSTSSAHNSHRSPPPHSFTPAAAPPPPPPPVPSLDDLLWMTTDSISALSISMLKQILFTNHVNAAQILEKSDLVKKVLTLVEDERGERERQRMAEEMEEVERHELERERQEERERELKEKEERERMAREGTSSRHSEDGRTDDTQGSQQSHSNLEVPSSPSPPLRSKSPKVPTMTSHIERTGLCVICQDEEANIAIVDCGHLAMCRGCSDMVMSSSRECPLCRTRIVTEARLLRIYKT